MEYNFKTSSTDKKNVKQRKNHINSSSLCVNNLNTRNSKSVFMIFFTSPTSIILSLFLAMVIFLLPLVMPTSFAFRLGDADPLINNIWLEPKNPKPGDMISIRSSIYNQGTQSTKEVTDVVTIGYFIDGNLVKISPLTNVRPGVENGIEISTGPIWLATDGVHTVTMILNYHDTLSHLSDNFENNIMQKKYYIGNWENPPNTLISFDLFQETIPNTQNQIIIITGKIVLPENYSKYNTPRVTLEFIDEKTRVHKFSIIVDRETNSFYFREIISVSNTVIPITVSFSDTRYNNSLYQRTQNLYPVSLNQNESLFVLTLPDSIKSNNFKNQEFTIAIYDESYQLIQKHETIQITDYPIKKIETIQLPASPFKKIVPTIQSNPILSTSADGDSLYFILPGDKRYNFEVYSENNLEYSTLKFLERNKILNDVMKNKNIDDEVIENKNINNVNLKQDESAISFKLSNPSDLRAFRNSEFAIIVWQDSYDNLFKQISISVNDELILTPDEELLTVLPANHKYIIEVYLDDILLDAFEPFLKSKDVITKEISIPESTHAKFEVLTE